MKSCQKTGDTKEVFLPENDFQINSTYVQHFTLFDHCWLMRIYTNHCSKKNDLKILHYEMTFMPFIGLLIFNAFF